MGGHTPDDSPNGARRYGVVLVTDDDSSDLQRRLRDHERIHLSGAVYPDAVDSILETARPSAAVIDLADPEATGATLELIRDRDSSAKTVVSPRPDCGGERHATVALRANATDYVPPEGNDDHDRTERVLSALEAALEDEPGGGAGVRANPETQSAPEAGSAPEEGSASEAEATAEPEERDRGERPTPSGDYHRVLANALPDEGFVIDEDGTYLEVRTRPESGDLYTVSADDLVGTTLFDAFPDDLAAELQACVDRTLETGDVQMCEYEALTTDGRRQFEARVVPIDGRLGGKRAVVWLARDVTERVKRERELRRRRDRLETLDRINAVVRRVIRTLVEAPTRTAIEREVCEQLVESDLYACAWIGEPTGDEAVSYRTGAAESERILDRFSVDSVGSVLPIACAVESGEIQTSEEFPTDSIRLDREDAVDDPEVRSAIAVPLAHDEVVYGVLVVFASRNDAFRSRERESFRLLGETIGFAINAVKNRRLLFSDSVVELELRVVGGDSFSFDLTTSYDCTCSLEWTGTTAEGRTYQYVTVDGLDGETVLEEATAHPSIEECRLIDDGTDPRCTIEMRLGKSGVRALTNHGVTIRDVLVEDGVGTAIVEVPRDADVREIVDALGRRYENTELVARREVERSVHTAAQRRDRILDALTERQLTTVRLAYYGGYFDWPRGSTGEEIAETMDVSPPTMHQHLRKALQAILSEFFGEEDDTVT
ncbi:bacterio-opsin activator domain-containing protein [Natrialbaceae archaeon GCM10025810]|uniref:bacterio-opsin activator domain-containing protein n=1 Tax=Halovalidus salilacus TaxID=3075124 RepID=UPI0036158248